MSVFEATQAMVFVTAAELTNKMVMNDHRAAHSLPQPQWLKETAHLFHNLFPFPRRLRFKGKVADKE